jgi:hypothetical protein
MMYVKFHKIEINKCHWHYIVILSHNIIHNHLHFNVDIFDLSML